MSGTEAAKLDYYTKKPSNVVAQRLTPHYRVTHSCGDYYGTAEDVGSQGVTEKGENYKSKENPQLALPQQLTALEPPIDPKTAEIAARARERRRARYDLRDTLATVTTWPRVRDCGRRPIDDFLEPPEVRVQADPARGLVAHFARLQLCGRVWLCPVCGPKIRQTRAEELDQAAARWIDRHGIGAVHLLTLTMPHDQGEELAEVLGVVRRAFGVLVAGRDWQADKADYGLAHYVRAHDVTVGAAGWHPHIHAVLFGRRQLTGLELERLGRRIFHRWANHVERSNRRRPEWQAFNLQQARNLGDVAGYVCQVVAGGPDEKIPLAFEVARGDLKTSTFEGQQTPWQVLEETTDRWRAARAAALWREWETATRGVHAIRWSKGLRKELELEPELTDDEIVAVEVGGDVVYQFRALEWNRAKRKPGLLVAILEAAERDGGLGVRLELERAGVAARLLSGVTP